jgi:hypothetical protein|nr:MAG TPA: protein of unknown function DUF3310 [Bacteriophage sp.]
MTDNINNPSHYQGRYGMESIDALRNFMTPEQLKGFLSWKCLEVPVTVPKEKRSRRPEESTKESRLAYRGDGT